MKPCIPWIDTHLKYVVTCYSFTQSILLLKCVRLIYFPQDKAELADRSERADIKG